ncbi:MAG: sigma-70 family RNA polymerase sigma factor [Kouleothrix sp.]|nr:sigma-70 family RNA polymerase sigma factor [Kouleothrix sp.]
MEPSDEALVLACRQGDAAAWEALIERYQRLIYTISRHAGLDEEQSADVFQRVFEMLVEHLHAVEQPALIGAWLATTTRHEAWRLSRRERMAQIAGDQSARGSPSADGVLLPDELMLRLEQQHQVRAALSELDDRCRRLLQLLFYRPEPPSYTEIATTLSMSEGSIGPTRARCLHKLRRLLNEADF